MRRQVSSPTGLLPVRKFIVGSNILADTISFLQDVGRQGYEGFVLWGGGHIDAGAFRFTRVIIPDQRAYATPRGLLVTVEGNALFDVNRTLYESHELLGGQVHTHPTTAYHSTTDNHYPLVTLLGSLSVVIPDFAQHAPTDIELWAWYRLAEYGRWRAAAEDTEVQFE